MTNQPHTGDFNQQLTTLQLIIGGLAMGPLVFAVVLLTAIPPQGEGDGPISKMALVAGLGAIFLHGPVGRMLRSRGSQAGQPLGSYTIALIISAAILEGGVFFNLIAHLMESSPWTLAMAALLWVSMVAKLPTRSRVQAYLEQESLRLRDEAQLRS